MKLMKREITRDEKRYDIYWKLRAYVRLDAGEIPDMSEIAICAGTANMQIGRAGQLCYGQIWVHLVGRRAIVRQSAYYDV